jgi:hypothetical protein
MALCCRRVAHRAADANCSRPLPATFARLNGRVRITSRSNVAATAGSVNSSPSSSFASLTTTINLDVSDEEAPELANAKVICFSSAQYVKVSCSLSSALSVAQSYTNSGSLSTRWSALQDFLTGPLTKFYPNTTFIEVSEQSWSRNSYVL